MSKRKRTNADDGAAPEGEGPSIDPSPELEEALREAARAHDARASGRSPESEESGDPAAAGAAAAGNPGADAESDEAIETDLAAELAASQDRLLRLQADFENFRRRSLKEREESFQYGHLNLAKDLLPTVDNLERALEAARGEGGESGALVQGVELVLRELEAVLARHGVEPIEAEGQPFDPAVHEAMAQTAHPDAPANTVIQVVQKGYRLRERLLRPAGVIVAKGPDA